MNNFLYIVKQYQPSVGYLGQPCAIFSSYEDAIKQASELNQKYAKNVLLDKDNQFVKIINEEDENTHYYTIEEMALNKGV